MFSNGKTTLAITPVPAARLLRTSTETVAMPAALVMTVVPPGLPLTRTDPGLPKKPTWMGSPTMGAPQTSMAVIVRVYALTPRGWAVGPLTVTVLLNADVQIL